MDVQSLKLNDYLSNEKKKNEKESYFKSRFINETIKDVKDKIDKLYNRYPRKIRFQIDCNREVSHEEVPFKLSWRIIPRPAVTELI